MTYHYVHFEYETETCRWIADVTSIPGVMAYGATQFEAWCAVTKLGYAVLAERGEEGTLIPEWEEPQAENAARLAAIASRPPRDIPGTPEYAEERRKFRESMAEFVANNREVIRDIARRGD